ncbi:GerAB/ArcD/ProY family transporter [Brevibacillus nitrificans]|uniref:GerAB/ArcD/ProY family transporter n=1 Tax=Brevibacillus nitrificans TaxID=651560 RepID=UPI00285CF864|nr:GerAB/ArcD/ProY family transporter [Brevibacillus nitrificans]MDR7316467.1 hypothetical protein [Brevibacillus nitrificans]
MNGLSRYFFYFVTLSILINAILFVPRILMDERYEGAILSMIIGSIIGGVCMYIFTSAMMRFRGKGLPEILKHTLPKIVSTPLLLLLGSVSFISGALVLINYAFIVHRYLIPESPIYVLLILFVVVASFGALQSTNTVLYSTELVLILSLPLLLFSIIKAYTNPNMNFDEVRAMIDYTWILPNWKSLSVSTYAVTGYISLSIFNRAFTGFQTLRHRWAIPCLGFSILLTAFFVPIGILGTDGVNDYIYTWVSTADWIRMKYAFIERVGSEMISGCLPGGLPNTASINSVLPNAISCAVFGIGTVVVGSWLGEDDSLIGMSR